MRARDYRRARGLLLWAGLIIVALVSFTMYIRDVDPIEIAAALFYAPILAGFLMFGFGAGVTLGLAAAGVYIGLRLPAIDLVGIEPLFGTILTRVTGYVVFGAAGGWAADQLRIALDRFALIDTEDEETGLGNLRLLEDVIEQETARAKRYGHPFSVVSARFADLGSNRRARAVLRALGRKLGSSIRAADRIAHVRNGVSHTIVVVLPETGAAGAEVVKQNLASAIRSLIDADLTLLALTDTGEGEDVLAPMLAELSQSEV